MSRTREDFHNSYQKNREAILERKRERYKQNRRKFADAQRKSLYGITSEQYEQMYREQSGLCFVCKEPSLHKKLSVDHCHLTGNIRRLICSGCNLLLGMAKDDSTLLRSAAQYLDDHRVKTCYVAGPMRHRPNFNFPLFNKISRLLRAEGWNVVSPAELDHAAKEPWTRREEPDFGDTSFPISKDDCRRLVKRDVDVLLSLRPDKGDAIVLLPGWRKSTGATAEHAVGMWLGLTIYEIDQTDGEWHLHELPK